MNTVNSPAMTKKRGYSTDFTPRLRTPESRRRITVDWIPPMLYDAVKAKAKREGLSLRALTLRLLKDWAESAEQVDIDTVSPRKDR